jgi:hypothetical protein
MNLKYNSEDRKGLRGSCLAEMKNLAAIVSLVMESDATQTSFETHKMQVHVHKFKWTPADTRAISLFLKHLHLAFSDPAAPSVSGFPVVKVS